MNVRSRCTGVCALALLLAPLALWGCSKSHTSPSSLCDNEGDDLIAFASDRGHAGLYDIFLYDADLGGFRLLKGLHNPAFSDSNPTLSRDGQLIAFVTNRDGPATSNLYIYERISCSLLPAPGLRTGHESEPTFSGDTRRLAFVRETGGARRIKLVNGGSLTFEALPGLDTVATFNDWSPAPDTTGDRIAFLSDREGGTHLYLYDRTTQKVDSLNDLRVAGAHVVDPSLTPDAHYLCFASDRAVTGAQGGFDIYLVDLTTHPRSFVTLTDLNSSGDDRYPRLSHSGSYIAFQSLSPDSTGWNVRYYVRDVVQGGGHLITPSPLASTGSDINPSVRLP